MQQKGWPQQQLHCLLLNNKWQSSWLLADILNLETIEVVINCFLTHHRPEITQANQDNFKEEFVKLIRKIGAEKYFLSQTASSSNSNSLLCETMVMAETGDYADHILTDLFRNIASDLIFFVLFQFVSFPHVVADQANIIEKKQLKAGRDKLV